MKQRPSWDEYFLLIAQTVSLRSTCPRRQVGVVIVDEGHRIVSTGYNGAPSGKPHCIDVGCLMVNGHCKRTIHADMNAIQHAGKHDLWNCTMYIYGGTPCMDCAYAIDESGIVRVVCHGVYTDISPVIYLREERGIKVDIVDVLSQPEPKVGSRAVWPTLQERINHRVLQGHGRYGTVLKANNGRAALSDALDEAIDLCFYLQQRLLEEEEIVKAEVQTCACDEEPMLCIHPRCGNPVSPYPEKEEK